MSDPLVSWVNGTHVACGLDHGTDTPCSQALDAIGYATGGYR